MTCNKCGAYNPEDAVYCNKCGNKVEPYATSFQGSNSKKNESSRRIITIAMTAAMLILGAVMALIMATRNQQSGEEGKKIKDRNAEPKYFQKNE